ncbi:NYN domain-containing protein [Schizophyllum fasciatum]
MSCVGIFWDYENCQYMSGCSGFEVAKNIERVALAYGPIANFNAYMDIQHCSAPASTRSELQSTGVALVDCPHNGQKDVVDQMLQTDMLVFALDHPAPATLVLISGDRDFAYVTSVLRRRMYTVILICHSTPGPHRSLLQQVSAHIDWNTQILCLQNQTLEAVSQASPRQTTSPPVVASSRMKATSSVTLPAETATPRVLVGDSLPLSDPETRFPQGSLMTENHSQSLFKDVLNAARLPVNAPRDTTPAVNTESPPTSVLAAVPPVAEESNNTPTATDSRTRFTPLLQALRSLHEKGEMQPLQNLGSPSTSVSQGQNLPMPSTPVGAIDETIADSFPMQSSPSLVPHPSTNMVSPDTQRGPADRDMEMFAPLVDVLRGLSERWDDRPRRAVVHVHLMALDRHLLARAGCENFGDYLGAAVAAGVVVVGGAETGENAWVALSNAYKDKSWAVGLKSPLDASAINLHGRHPSPIAETATAAQAFPALATYSPDLRPISSPPTDHAFQSRLPQSSPLSSGIAAAQYQPLINIMHVLLEAGNVRPRTHEVANRLLRSSNQIYKQFGVKDAQGYFVYAAAAGIIELGGEDTNTWVTLTPQYAALLRPLSDSVVPGVPSQYQPLIQLLRAQLRAGYQRSNCSVIGGILRTRDPAVFKKAGVSDATAYLFEASEAGLVDLGGGSKEGESSVSHPWVALAESCRRETGI